MSTLAPTNPAVAAPPVPADVRFDTAHLRGDLRGRTVRAGSAMLLAQGANFALKIGSTAVLARLLDPRDFGLVAMATAVTGFVELFRDAGLSTATVQRGHVTHRQVSTLFWVNAGLGVAVACVIAAASPLVGWFYGRPELGGITLALAATALVGGLAAQSGAILRRQMRFGTVAAIRVASAAVGVAAAVAAALAGWGYWSLVALPLATAATVAVLNVAAARWVPGRPGTLAEVREMLGFGGHLAGFQAVNYLGRNADNILLGRFVGAGPLGLYTKAYGLLMMPLKQVNAPLSSAIVPALSRLQDDPAGFRRAYLRGLRATATVTVPLVAFLAAASGPVVGLVLGPGWGEAADIFAVLAVAALFQPVLGTMGWVNTALGDTRRMMHWSLICVPLFLLAFAAGLPWGPVGVAAGYAVAVNALLLPGFWFCLRSAPVGVGDVARAAAAPTLLAAGVFAGALAGVLLTADLPDVAGVAAAAVGAAAAAGVVLGASSSARREVRDVLSLRRELKPAAKREAAKRDGGSS